MQDIAEVAATALTADGHQRKAYSLTGPRLLSFSDIAGESSAATGRDIRPDGGAVAPQRPYNPAPQTRRLRQLPLPAHPGGYATGTRPPLCPRRSQQQGRSRSRTLRSTPAEHAVSSEKYEPASPAQNCNTSPTLSVDVDGKRFAYREFGPSTGVPVVFLHHFTRSSTTGTRVSSTESHRNVA